MVAQYWLAFCTINYHVNSFGKVSSLHPTSCFTHISQPEILPKHSWLASLLANASAPVHDRVSGEGVLLCMKFKFYCTVDGVQDKCAQLLLHKNYDSSRLLEAKWKRYPPPDPVVQVAETH